MTTRTSTVTQKVTVTAAPGRAGTITLTEGAELDYVFNEANGVYSHDADQLFDTLRYLLPEPTWARLCELVKRMP